MSTAARTFIGAPELVGEWTSRILRARYEQSLLGWLWAIVQPAAQASILAIVFTRVVPVETGETPYLLFSYVAMVPWAFLAGSLADMTESLVGNMSLIGKVYFPREVLPLASALARLVDFGVAVLFFFVVAWYFGTSPWSGALVWLPVIVLVQVLLVSGVGLAAAALNVFARDVRSILVLVTQLWFYASPVLYPLEMVPAGLRAYFVLNPMVGIIEGYRAVLLRAEAPGATFLVAGVVSAAVCAAGFALFKTLEFRFADIV